MRMLSAIVATTCLCITAIAQAPGAHWTVTTATGNPPQRRENPGTASETHMYVFGGKSGGSGGVVRNDLWQFDGTSWTEMTVDGAVGSPTARHQAGVTWDFARNKLVVYGGRDAVSTVLGDVWEWDPNTNLWTDVTPATGPTARYFTALSWDPSNGGILMFGGLDASNTHLNDTWVFIGGTTWLPFTPANVPPTRRQHHLVTRMGLNDVLLCGGQEATLPSPTKWRVDTWTWDGQDWTEIVTVNAPAAQVANDAAYDERRQRVVLAGGNGTAGTSTVLISEFDSIANDWVQRPLDTGIYKITRYFAGYIQNLGKTYKASGQALNASAPWSSTYEYQSDVLAGVMSYGAGCNGQSGNVLTLVANNQPWAGRTWTGTCYNLGSASFALGVWGATTASLPLDTTLPGFGQPGCVLLNTAEAIIGPDVPVAGTVDIAFPLPADPAIAGAQVHAQVAELDFSLSSLWMSNGVTLTVGAL